MSADGPAALSGALAALVVVGVVLVVVGGVSIALLPIVVVGVWLAVLIVRERRV